LTLEQLSIKYYITDGFEADDVISSYIIQCRNQMEIFIVSNDSDFFQLVDENVSVYVYRGKNSVTYDENRVYDKYYIKPEQMADYKALCGDKCDNIKGMPRIGPKTAVKLLNQFGSINAILNNLSSISSLYIRSALADNIYRIKTNIEIIKLSSKAPIPFVIDDLENKRNHENIPVMKLLREIGVAL
jgi:DNA polymerase-1